MSRKKFNPNCWGYINAICVKSGVWGLVIVKVPNDSPVLIDLVNPSHLPDPSIVEASNWGLIKGMVRSWGYIANPSRVTRRLLRKAMRLAQNQHALRTPEFSSMPIVTRCDICRAGAVLEEHAIVCTSNPAHMADKVTGIFSDRSFPGME